MTLFEKPNLEPCPDADTSELLEAVAQNAQERGTPPITRPVRRRPAPASIEEWGDDTDTILKPTKLALPKQTPPEGKRAQVQEAAVWQTEDHPRWPKGTPGGKGGEFIRVGELFTSGGKTWQVSNIVKGRIYANEASAKYQHVETKAFDVGKEQGTGNTIVPDAEYKAPPKVPKGGKSQSSEITIVDPYVNSESHDPSIQLPEHSQLSQEEWARFGKQDQEHYVELMERFGKHKPGSAKTHVDSAYQAYSAKVQQMVKTGYSAQYGSSSGYSLSIAAGGSHGYGGHGIQDTPELAKLREECLALQGEHKAAVQWDLYNRCKSPDVLVVHKDSSNGPQWWEDQFIKGDHAIMSGLSQSFCYRRGFFGSHGVATPLAIRHVLLSSASAQPIPGSTHFPSELEVSVMEQMKYDHRSIAITAAGSGKHTLSASQIAWLEGMTNEPVGGHVLDTLRDSIDNGTYLPPPPKPPHLQMGAAGGKTYIDPPAQAAKPDFYADAPAVSKSNTPENLPKSLPWKHLDKNGNPEAVTGKDAGVKQGDYFMGLQGTLYYVGHDPGNAHTGYPFTIHKIVNGEFDGSTYAYSPDLPGYYLEAHLEHKLPKPEDAPEFNAHEWVKSTEQKFMDQFEVGEKFKLEGNAYEVTGKVGGKIQVKDLENGMAGSINGDYLSTWLVPHDGAIDPSVAVQGPSFGVGDHVVTPDFKGTVDAVDESEGYLYVTPHHSNVQFDVPMKDATKVPTQKATVGMTLPFTKPGTDTKVKATVTKIHANGDVQINLKPGVHVIKSDEWDAHSINAYDPGAHTIGEKTKLRDLAPGDKFHGSQGNNTHRPYEVVYQKTDASGGKKTWVRNLDTGDVTEMSAHKSYPTLDELKPEQESSDLDVPKSVPSSPTEGDVGAAYDPNAYELSGAHVAVTDMQPGDMWQTKSGGVYKKTAHTDEHSTIVAIKPGSDNIAVGESIDLPHSYASDNKMPLLQRKGAHVPSEEETDGNAAEYALANQEMAADYNADGSITEDAATGFDKSKYFEGDKLKIGEMKGGTIFKTTSKKGDKYYQLSEDGSYTTNLVTGKVYPTKPHYHANVLNPKTVDEPQVHDTSGDPEIIPQYATVFFDPKTKQSDMTHATVISQDPMSGVLAVCNPHTGNTVYVDPSEIARVVPQHHLVAVDELDPGMQFMTPSGSVWEKTDHPGGGEAKLVKKVGLHEPKLLGETNVFGELAVHVPIGHKEAELLGIDPPTVFDIESPDAPSVMHAEKVSSQEWQHAPNLVAPKNVEPGTMLRNYHGDVFEKMPNGDLKVLAKNPDSSLDDPVGSSFSPYNDSPVFQVYDGPNPAKVASMKSSGHTATVKQLASGKKQYYVNGEEFYKASSADYTHVTLWAPVKDGGKPQVMFHKSAAAAMKATSHGGNGYNTNKIATIAIEQHDSVPIGAVPLQTLKPGDEFAAPSILGKDKTAIVVSNEGGKMYVKSSTTTADVQGAPVPRTFFHSPVTLVKSGVPIPEETAGNTKTKSTLGTNATGMTFGQMPIGTVFSPGHGGIKYTKTSYGSATKVGDPDQFLDLGQDYVPDDLHALPATQLEVGKLATVVPNPSATPSVALKNPTTGYITKVRDKDGAVQIDGGMLWHTPEHTTIHAMSLPPIKGGDVVHHEDGSKGTFHGWGYSSASGTPHAIVDPTGNMDVEHWDPAQLTGVDVGTGFEQEGTVLNSKAHLPTPYDQLTKGDNVTLKDVKVGDVVEVPGVPELYKVVAEPEPDVDYQFQNYTFSTLLSDGSWGQPYKTVMGHNDEVIFNSKGDEFVPPAIPWAAEEDFPNALEHGFESYPGAAGGPFVHTQLANMPKGTVFEDAGGGVWKIKQAGPNPVISGGAQNYVIDGSVWGKDLSQPNTQPPQHADTTPPTGDADLKLAQAQLEVVTNTQDYTLGELNLKPGEFVEMDGGMWEYEGKGSLGGEGETWLFQNLETGEYTHKGWAKTPLRISPSAIVDAEPVEQQGEADGGGVPEYAGVPTSLYSSPSIAMDLPNGTKITMAKGSSHVYTIKDKNPGYIELLDEDGKSVHLDPPEVVYTQPGDDPNDLDPGLSPNIPPPPDADPDTLPPVEGPNGFAPETKTPVLDENFQVGGPLDPFTTLTGSGGVVKYPKLETTQAGQLFTDKSGKDYRVVQHGTAETVYEDVASGQQYSAPSSSRVKLTALPPDPGPQLKGLVLDLTTKYGSLENVPKVTVNGHSSTYGSDGKTKNPRLGHLNYGDVGYDADGNGFIFLAAWLDRALVLDNQDGQVKLASGRRRVTLSPPA